MKSGRGNEITWDNDIVFFVSSRVLSAKGFLESSFSFLQLNFCTHVVLNFPFQKNKQTTVAFVTTRLCNCVCGCHLHCPKLFFIVSLDTVKKRLPKSTRGGHTIHTPFEGGGLHTKKKQTILTENVVGLAQPPTLGIDWAVRHKRKKGRCTFVPGIVSPRRQHTRSDSPLGPGSVSYGWFGLFFRRTRRSLYATIGNPFSCSQIQNRTCTSIILFRVERNGRAWAAEIGLSGSPIPSVGFRSLLLIVCLAFSHSVVLA